MNKDIFEARIKRLEALLEFKTQQQVKKARFMHFLFYSLAYHYNHNNPL